jgi:hypothetical protein
MGDMIQNKVCYVKQKIEFIFGLAKINRRGLPKTAPNAG